MLDQSITSTQVVSTQDSVDRSAIDVTQKVADDSQVLFQTKTIFPLELFPTKVSVDKAKVSVITTLFFSSKEIKSLPIKDIFTVTVDSGPLFAQVSIVDRMARQAPVVIDKLPVAAALKLRRIIQGLVIASNEQLDLTGLSLADQVRQIEKLGSTKT